MMVAMNEAQKDQSKERLLSESLSSDSLLTSNGLMHKAKNTLLFSIPKLFVGCNTKNLSSDSDAVRSPTSPLDYKGFPNLCNSFIGSPRSASLKEKKSRCCWDCSRVGLSLVDTLNDGKLLGSSESRSILFGPHVRINISKSLPKDYGISSQTQNVPLKSQLGSSRMFLQYSGAESECKDYGLVRCGSADTSRSFIIDQSSQSDSDFFTLDSCREARGSANFEQFSGSLPISTGSADSGVMTSLSASEIEQSEDYTRIISHGPNPKTTHIFGDCILESHSFPSKDYKNKEEEDQDSMPCFASNDLPRFCSSCKKKLEDGRDMYIYRSKKAFCSCDCRDKDTLIEEEMENLTTDSSGSPASSFHEDILLEGMTQFHSPLMRAQW